MQMPEMDGEMLGRAIKADPLLTDTRLVMMTSLGDRGKAEHLREIGFVAYLTKPVRRSELLDCLTRVLTGKTSREKEPAAASPSAGKIRRDNVRILVAEDNVVNQMVALRILEKLGISADAVANGAEAIKSLEQIPYDLVFMDMQMPEMDGFEATRIIREREAAGVGILKNQEAGKPDQGRPISNTRSRIPIIAMTAHAMQGYREKCLKAGMDDYVSKPVHPRALADMINKWLPE